MAANDPSSYSILYSAITGLVAGVGSASWWGGKTDAKIKLMQDQMNRLELSTGENHRQVMDILTRAPSCQNYHKESPDE